MMPFDELGIFLTLMFFAGVVVVAIHLVERRKERATERRLNALLNTNAAWQRVKEMEKRDVN